MHAVVVRVTITEQEQAQKMLEEQVVPMVSSAPGFVNGYWMRRDDTGMSVVLVESEEAANGIVEQLRSGPGQEGGPVTLEDVEVREVVAQA